MKPNEFSPQSVANPDELATIQEHAFAFYTGRDYNPPPLPREEHLANPVLREWFATLDDLATARRLRVEMKETIEYGAEVDCAFQIVRGRLQINPAHNWVARPLPAFRSGDAAAPLAVVYSDIVPLEHGCVLLELRASEFELRLNLRAGGKNQGKIYISLYTKDHLVEKSLLYREASWDLSHCEPGQYRVECGSTPALSFQIQE